VKPYSGLIRALLLGVMFAGSAWSADKVNINSATAEQLGQGLTGVGPAKAKAIVKHRDENGPFTSIEDLALVKGIGNATVEGNRDRMTVGDRMAPADKAGRTPAAKPVERR